MTWPVRNAATEFKWNDVNTALTVELWKKGRSARQIAIEIDCPSRNAVIGKVHRLGLRRDEYLITASRGSRRMLERMARRASEAAKPKREPKPKRLPTVVHPNHKPDLRPVRMDPVEPLNVALEANDKGCRYPTAFEGEHLFCGHVKQDGASYCPAHVQLTTNVRPPLRARVVKPDFVAQAHGRRCA